MSSSHAIAGMIAAAVLAALGSCAPSARPVGASGIAGSGASVAAAPSGLTASGDVESVEAWSFNGVPGRIIRTANYRIFTTQPDTVISARVPSFLEAALAQYRTAFAPSTAPLPSPDLKLDTFILRSRPDWVLLTRQLTGDQAELFLRIQRGGFAFGGKALMFDIGPRDTLAVLAHEGWHQYTQRTFRQPLPIWLEEGLGTYMEGHRWGGASGTTLEFLPWCNVERFDQLRKAEAHGRLMGLKELLTSAPQDVLSSQDDRALVYYAQVWSLVHFLAEGEGGKYRAALGELLSDAASGTLRRRIGAVYGPEHADKIIMQRRGPLVFQAYIDANLERASAEYEAFMRTLVRSGSRGAIVDGRSPLPPR